MAAGTIASYPGSFAGNLLGAGADLDVAQGACAVEAPPWIDERGEDQVIELDGLTPGATYGVVLASADDLGFYVMSDCTTCVLFDDQTVAGEEDSFAAPASGRAWIVVDTALASSSLASGDYTLDVAVPQCAGSFDCASASAPVCDDADQCAAGPTQCTGDDARDSGSGDDGPAAATALAEPIVGVPTAIAGDICNVPASEGDWFAITASADETLALDLSWIDTSTDLDLFLFDASGNVVASAQSNGAGPEHAQAAVVSGTYYILIVQFAPAAMAAASAYTLSASLP